MSVVTTDQVLDEAANLLDRDGWCRFNLTNDLGAHCARGAIGVVSPFAGLFSTAVRAVEMELGGMLISTYNDGVAKDKRYVTRRLRRVARNLRKAQS